MFNIIKYIFTIGLICAILFATTGIEIYHHICIESGSHSTRIFQKANCEGHDQNYFCKHCHLNDCFVSDSNENQSIENNCCNEFSEYISIKSDIIKADDNKILIKNYIIGTLKIADLLPKEKEDTNLINEFHLDFIKSYIIKFIYHQSNPQDVEDSFC